MTMIKEGNDTIGRIFEGRHYFVVPTFQRAYAWEEDHLSDFLSDIQNQKQGDSYFLGTFLFQRFPINGNKHYFDTYYVVDGQQRLTTLVIFMNEALKRLSKGGTSMPNDVINDLKETYLIKNEMPKFQTITNDNNIFQDYVLGAGSDPEIEVPSQRRLLAARTFFEENLAPLSTSEIESCIQVIDGAKVLVYSVEDNSEASLIFETTNDRGKRLTDLEAIKSFLMRQLYLAHENQEAAEKASGKMQTYFSSIYRNCEKLEQTISDDDGLRYYYIGYRRTVGEYSKAKDDIKIYTLDLFKKNKSLAAKYAQTLARELTENFDKLRKIALNEPIIEWIDDIFALGRIANFYPLLLKAFVPPGDAKFSEFERVTHLCEIYSLTVWGGISGYRSNKGVSHLDWLAYEFNGKNKNHKWLINNLKEYFDQLEIEFWFKNGLESPGFYHYGKNARYILWKYENKLRDDEGYTAMSPQDFLSGDGRKRLTIEHIAAQKGEEVERCQIDRKSGQDFKEQWLHHIGNLTIDPQSPNSKKGNIPVPSKRSIFQKAPLMCQNELDDFLNNGEWDTSSIQDRATKLIDFATEYWSYKKV